MAAFDFPSSPTVGQTYTPAGGGPTYSWNGTAWVVVNAGAGFSQQTFTATLGQTVFTVTSGYQIGLIDVFQNGVKLVLGSDYTASNGTTIVLSAPAALGDTIQTICYAAVSGANTYTKAEVDALLRGPMFYAQLSAAQNLTNNALTGVLFDNEVADTANGYNPANGRFTPNVAGWYQFNMAGQFGGGAATRGFGVFRKVGVEINRTVDIVVQNTTVGIQYATAGTALIYCNGTTDYVDFGIYTSAGTQATLLGGSFFSGHLARRA